MSLVVPRGERELLAVAADLPRCAQGFEDLLSVVGPPPAITAELRRRYGEPHRAYHNAEHVGLLWLRHLGHGGDRGDMSLARAILFHDAIYDPRAQDNEEQSARLLARLMPGDPWAETAIRATADHVAYGGSDARIMRLLDLDLSPLGEEEPVFLRNSDALRREFAHVSDADWEKGRHGVLGRFLNAPALFRTEVGALYADRARRNLAAALAAL
jgi:predicted metal-dependent HD superfamily phosphohydrolase